MKRIPLAADGGIFQTNRERQPLRRNSARHHIRLVTIMPRAISPLHLFNALGVFAFSNRMIPRRKRVASLVALSLLAFIAPRHAYAASKSAVYLPAPRTDQNSLLGHEKLVEK